MKICHYISHKQGLIVKKRNKYYFLIFNEIKTEVSKIVNK